MPLSPVICCQLLEFVESKAPIAMLADFNQLTYEDTKSLECLQHPDSKLSRLAVEVKALCDDLRVLNKKDFKTLLLWRTRLLDSTRNADSESMDEQDASTIEVDTEAEEESLFGEMQEIKDRAAARVKRDAKKLKRRRMKAKARQIMGGETAVDFVDDMEMFHLSSIKGTGIIDKLTKGAATQVNLTHLARFESDGRGNLN
eukprot:SAG11_NODE_1054_length_6018_cov_2.481250_4_plen_201_part_00